MARLYWTETQGTGDNRRTVTYKATEPYFHNLVWVFGKGMHHLMDLVQFHGTYFVFFRFHTFFLHFQRFRREHHLRDLSSRNAHLVHQN
jgi:hypothetical protein